MKVTLYAVTTYYLPTIADAWSRGMVVTDDRDARAIATAVSGDGPVIRTCEIDVPDTAWAEYAQ